jgi:hypothetical protein
MNPASWLAILVGVAVAIILPMWSANTKKN